jgi:HEAT repeat protein
MVLAFLPHLVAVAATTVLALPRELQEPPTAAPQSAPEQHDPFAEAAALIETARTAYYVHDDVRSALEALDSAEALLASAPKAAAPDALSRSSGEAALRAEVEAIREAIRGTPAAVPEVQREISVTRDLQSLVRDAVRRMDAATLHRIGSHALPVLETILTAPHDDATRERALLTFLSALPNPTSAMLRARLARGQLGEVEPYVVDAVARRLAEPTTWFALTDIPPRRFAWTSPELALLVEDLLDDSRMRELLVEKLTPVSRRNAWTPAMIDRLGTMLASEDLALAQLAFRLVQEDSHPSPGAAVLLERGLASPHDGIRLRSAEELHKHPPVERYPSLAEDGNAAIRLSIANGLKNRKVSLYGATATSDGDWDSHKPASYAEAFPEPTRNALARLLQDPVVEVRLAALAALPPIQSRAFPVQAISRIASQGTPQERLSLARTELPASIADRIWIELAKDPDPDVQKEVDHALLQGRILNATPLLTGRWERLMRFSKWPEEFARRVFLRTPAFESLMEWVVTEGAAVQLVVLEHLMFVEGVNQLDFVRAVPPHLFTAWVARLSNTPFADSRVHWSSARLVEYLSENVARPSPHRAEIAAELLANTALPTHLRLGAAKAAATRPQESFATSLAQLLAQLSERATPPTHEEFAALSAAGQALPVASTNRVLARLVADRDLETAWLAPLLREFRLRAPDADVLARAIFERWDGSDGVFPSFAGFAMAVVRERPELATPTLLRRAIHDRDLAPYAVEILALRRNAADVSLLAECLEGALPSEVRTTVALTAVQALLSIGDDAAVEILLAGLSHSIAQVRKACADALDELERVRQRRDAWRARAEAGATIETALADLRPLLEHADVTIRAEAVRSLGTLGSPLDIPRLIPLLADKEPRVREAARAALDRLHAMDAPTPKAASPLHAPGSKE